jgi:hypothetical protein
MSVSTYTFHRGRGDTLIKNSGNHLGLHSVTSQKATVNMKMVAFWDIEPCSLIEVDWRGAYCLLCQKANIFILATVRTRNLTVNMKMVAFWDIEPCSLIEVDWRGAYCLLYQKVNIFILATVRTWNLTVSIFAAVRTSNHTWYFFEYSCYYVVFIDTVKPLFIVSELTVKNKRMWEATFLGKLFIWAMCRDQRNLTILARRQCVWEG